MCLAFASGLFACSSAMLSLLRWRRNLLIVATSCFASQGNIREIILISSPAATPLKFCADSEIEILNQFL